MTTFDLDLFLSLNAEYAEKPLVPAPPRYDGDSLAFRGNKRANDIMAIMGKPGRVLEIGCGHGEVSRALATQHGCQTVGVEVSEYPGWDVEVPNVTLLQHDLSAGPVPGMEQFDLIYSNSVFEHVVHPFAMLNAAYDLLKPGGRLVINANLYRGPKASHRYGQVYFPWPHLLFTDSVFEEFYASIGQDPAGAAWVNQLSIADYFRYFDMVGFERVVTRYSVTPLDRPFYDRFSDLLERFPIFDLERDFLRVQLIKPLEQRAEGFIEHTQLLKQKDSIQRRLQVVESRNETIQARLDRTQAKLDSAQARADKLAARCQLLTDQNIALKERNSGLSTRAKKLSETNSELAARNKRLTGKVEGIASKQQILERRESAARDAVTAMANSTSWRVTAPLRVLARVWPRNRRS